MRSPRRSRSISRLAVAGIAVVFTAACGGDDGAPESSPTVEIERSRFAPLEIEVTAGETVRFVNLDPYAHTVTAREGGPVDFDSGNLAQDETYDLTFDENGTYDYFCLIHPTMRAQVIVG